MVFEKEAVEHIIDVVMEEVTIEAENFINKKKDIVEKKAVKEATENLVIENEAVASETEFILETSLYEIIVIPIAIENEAAVSEAELLLEWVLPQMKQKISQLNCF